MYNAEKNWTFTIYILRGWGGVETKELEQIFMTIFSIIFWIHASGLQLLLIQIIDIYSDMYLGENHQAPSPQTIFFYMYYHQSLDRFFEKISKMQFYTENGWIEKLTGPSEILLKSVSVSWP
jgi:hypothetical protein